MIRLSLTAEQATQLHQLLVDVVHQGETHAQRQASQLLSLLMDAQAMATTEQQCPVCQTWFTQARQGRTGQYCSAACKQKAYRQRKQAWARRRPRKS